MIISHIAGFYILNYTTNKITLSIGQTGEETDTMYKTIEQQARQAIQELLAEAKLPKGSLVVVGCSSSEVLGAHIGKGSSPEVGNVVAKALLEETAAAGMYLAAQCCEHLNRALILEQAAAEKFGYEPVCVKPQPKAGGSFATAVWNSLTEPVAVEHVRAAAGLDIGLTLIGMHLKEVAVPVRLQTKYIGEALLTAARTRPKYVGGPRAEYP